MNRSRQALAMLATVALSLFLCSCGGPPSPPAPPPAEVTQSPATQREVTSYLEYTGTTAAVESVEIRARVSGYLQGIHFEPRSKVKAGDVLFVIDPRPYRAKVEQAKAALESKRAALRIREIELQKYAPLASKEVIAELKLDDVRSNRDMAKAEVEQAVANLEAAKLDLDYAHVKSPIDGRVSRNLVDIGNLVGASESTLLANVVRDESMYVYFNMSEVDLLRLTRRALKNSGDSAPPQDQQAPAYMGLADEKEYPRTGTLDYTDIKVDPSTGTIQVRAVFENLDGILYPGMFARIRVPLNTRTALLVPDTAVLTDQGGKYVLVCNAENVCEFRRVKTGELLENMRVIRDGLTLQDQVIINGIQKARPGVKVAPVQATAQSAPPLPGPQQPTNN
jgi:membrane fusion protein, multidrug efflux system